VGKKSRHITDKDIEVIIELLDGWDGSLTWEALCAACVKAIGFKPTRQTLHKFSRVAGAYRLAKEREKNDVKDLKIPATLAVAAQRIERLTREVERLERECCLVGTVCGLAVQRLYTWDISGKAK
jgi:hypothetical protein